MPEALGQAPTPLRAHLAFYFNAFAELHGCRSAGLSEGAIPWTALDAYARRHGIAGLEFEDFSYLVRALDDEWLKVMVEKRKAEEVKAKTNPRSPFS